MSVTVTTLRDASVRFDFVGPVGTRSSVVSINGYQATSGVLNVTSGSWTWTGAVPNGAYNATAAFYSGLDGSGILLESTTTPTFVTFVDATFTATDTSNGVLSVHWDMPAYVQGYPAMRVTLSWLSDSMSVGQTQDNFGPNNPGIPIYTEELNIGYQHVHVAAVFYWGPPNSGTYIWKITKSVDITLVPGGGPPPPPPPSNNQVAVRQSGGTWTREPVALGMQVRSSSGTWVAT